MPAMNRVALCPWCEQPLVDRDAAARVARKGREDERRIATMAEARAKELSARLLEQADRERERRDAELEQLRKELAAVREEHQRTIKSRAAQVAAIEKKADERAESKLATKMRSLNQTVEVLRQQKEALERRVERLTADERGNFSEEDLLRGLRAAFPGDRIEKLGRSGDVHQHVIDTVEGAPAKVALLVYECKDTLHWSNAFLEQALQTARDQKTPYVVVVSSAMPPKQRDLAVRGDVVVVSPSKAIELARILRRMAVEIHRSGLAGEGKAEKADQLYRYLASDEFRADFSALAGSLERVKGFLHDERQAHQKVWEKRQLAYDEIADKSSAIDGRIREIVERRSIRAKLVRLPSA